jgi:hypothetical protein
MEATAEVRWIPRRPAISTYVGRLGIDSSIIRQLYELLIATGTSSTKKITPWSDNS